MAVRSRKIRAFCLFAFLGAASFGQSAAHADGSSAAAAPAGNAVTTTPNPAAAAPDAAAPTNYGSATADDAKNPDIVKPDELGAPCKLNVTAQDEGQIKQATGGL